MQKYNHNFPYHDYAHFDDGAEPTVYQVGKNNNLTSGTQHKLFTSKSTLLMATATTTVRFNSSENVLITLVANQWYTFYSNIYALYIVAIGDDGELYAYFEGVLPDETTQPE